MTPSKRPHNTNTKKRTYTVTEEDHEALRKQADEIDRLKAQLRETEEKGRVLMDMCRNLKARVMELESGSLQAIANKVCGELPEDWMVGLYMENGAAWVEAIKPSGYTIDIDRSDFPLVEQIGEAIRLADEIEKSGG